MDPYSGEAFQLREELTDGAEPGDSLDMSSFVQRLASIQDATEDELRASQRTALVAISNEAAQKLKLGEREIERRKKRRKQAREARKRNR